MVKTTFIILAICCLTLYCILFLYLIVIAMRDQMRERREKRKQEKIK